MAVQHQVKKTCSNLNMLIPSPTTPRTFLFNNFSRHNPILSRKMSAPRPDSLSDPPKNSLDHSLDLDLDLEKNLPVKHDYDRPVPESPQTLPQQDSHDTPPLYIIGILSTLTLYLTALCVWFFMDPCSNPMARFLVPMLFAVSCSMAVTGWLRSYNISPADWSELSQLFLVMSYIFTGFFLTQGLNRARATCPNTVSTSDPVRGHKTFIVGNICYAATYTTVVGS